MTVTITREIVAADEVFLSKLWDGKIISMAISAFWSDSSGFFVEHEESNKQRTAKLYDVSLLLRCIDFMVAFFDLFCSSYGEVTLSFGFHLFGRSLSITDHNGSRWLPSRNP